MSARNNTIKNRKMADTIFLAFLLVSSHVLLDCGQEEATGFDRRMHCLPSLSGLYYVRNELRQFQSTGNFNCICMPCTTTRQNVLHAVLSEGSDWSLATVSEGTMVRPGVMTDHCSERRRTHIQHTSGTFSLRFSAPVFRHHHDTASLQNFSTPLECQVCPAALVFWTRLLFCCDPRTAFTGRCMVKMSGLYKMTVLACRGCVFGVFQTAGAHSLNTAATMTVAKLCSLLSSELHTSLTTGLFENGLFCMFKIHKRTKCVHILPEIVNIIKHYPNVSEAVIRLLRGSRVQLVATKGELSTNFLSPSLLWHGHKSTKYCLVCILYPPFVSVKRVKQKVLMCSMVNNVKVCTNVSSALNLSQSHFFPLHYRYAIHILYLLVSILCIHKYLCKETDKMQITKSSGKGTRFGNAWFCIGSGEMMYHSAVDSYSHNKSLFTPRTSVLYDIIHHPWRLALQRLSNRPTNPQPSVTTKHRGNYRCLCSTSSLCPTCVNLASLSLRPEDRVNIKPSATSSPDTRSAEQSVIHVYPVTGFLPDPTRNPSQDLCHVGYRLATLSALPSSMPVSRVRLADAGFYFRGVNDEVTCYSCHVQHSGWTRDDNPLEVHRRLSPTCLHLMQRDEMSSGISSGSESAAAARSCGGRHGEAVAGGRSRGTDSSPSATSYFEDGDRSSLPTNSGPATNTPAHTATNETRAQTTRHNSDRGIASQTRSHESSSTAMPDGRPGNSSATVTVSTDTFSSARPSTNPEGNSGTPASPLPNSGSGDTSGAAELPSTNPAGRTPGTRSLPAERGTPGSPVVVPALATSMVNGSSVTPTSDSQRQQSGSSASDHPSRSVFPGARLELGGAVYPMYQDMASRRRSFTTAWDESRAPPLVDVLLCGMFYAGYGDCVRCFYCGVGLKHWEVTDNVWEEHVRWRPECQYLRLVKGDDFIRNTQRRLGISISESSQRNPNGPASAASQRQQQSTLTSAITAGTASTATPPLPLPSAAGTATTTATLASTSTAIPLGQAPGSSSGSSSSPTTVTGSGGRRPEVRASVPVSQGTATNSSTPASESRRSDGPTVPVAGLSRAPRPSGGGSCQSSSNNDSSNNDSSNSGGNRPSCSSGGGNGVGESGAERARGEGGGDNGTVEITAGDEQRTVARFTEENRTLARNLQCRVCHRASVDTILLPCAHLVVCETCARSVTLCPLCAEAVRATARVYMA